MNLAKYNIFYLLNSTFPTTATCSLIICNFSILFVHNGHSRLQNCLLTTYTRDDQLTVYLDVQTLFLYLKLLKVLSSRPAFKKVKFLISLQDHFEFVSSAHVHSHIQTSEKFGCRGHGLTMRSVLYSQVSMVMTTMTSQTDTPCTLCWPTPSKNDVYFKW